MYTETKRLLVDRAFAQKKIRLDKASDIKPVVDELFRYVEYFNSVDEYTTLIFDKPISDIIIIKELSHFIIPASVRIDSADKGWKDLLLRCEKPAESEKLSLNRFYDLQMQFRGFFKRGMFEDNMSLAELKKHYNLVDMLPLASIGGKVWYKGNPFMPIMLNDKVDFIDRGLHYIVAEDEVIMDFINTLSLT